MPKKDPANLALLRSVIHQEILAKHRSVELFCHEFGLDQSVLSRFVKGERGVTLATFLRIAEALDLDLGPLFPFGKRTSHLGSGKTPVYSSKPTRRTKVTVSMDETRTIEIKQHSGDAKPVLSLKIG
jgi:transcriptional regulator with XRE-family HTH domain